MGACIRHPPVVQFIAKFKFIRYQIATGSGDDTVRIWDMRSLKALYTIPAHKSTVSDVQFFRREYSSLVSNGDTVMGDASVDAKLPPLQTGRNAKFADGIYLVSSGYDGLVKMWSADDWQLTKTLSTDAGKVMSVDMSPGGQYIASGSWNRSIQLYSPE